MNNDGDDIADAKFVPHTLLGFTFNLNREADKDLLVMHSFDDLIPHFDLEVGPTPFLKVGKGADTINVPLNAYVASRMRIDGANEMDDPTYYEAFAVKRKRVAEALICQTYAKGFETPSAVQAVATMELVLGRDCLVQSKSGTGKTHTFLMGTAWHFDPDDKRLQHIFITATHEVATQIYDQVVELLPTDTSIALCIGRKNDEQKFAEGFRPPVRTSNIVAKGRPQLTSVQERIQVQKAQIIVGTMGKIYDFLYNKQWANMDSLKSFCVDEFDTIVTSRSRAANGMNTEEQIADIIKVIPVDTQRAFFSATINARALKISYNYFRRYNPDIGEPFLALLDIDDYTLEGIKQYYVECSSNEEKQDVLLDLISQCRIAQGIIFANKIGTADDLKALLDRQEIPISSAVFHSNLSAQRRQEIHQSLKDNKVRLLISTDITSRGLDLQSVNVVFNFDMPDSLDTYIHRVGRSGRYGRKGVAISLVLVNQHKDEMRKVKGINECSKSSPMEQLPENLGCLL